MTRSTHGTEAQQINQSSILLSFTPAGTLHTPFYAYTCGNSAVLDWMMPTMIPKMPRADAKISTMRIFTNRDASWASPRAHALPATPTEIPLARFVNPTPSPPQKSA